MVKFQGAREIASSNVEVEQHANPQDFSPPPPTPLPVFLIRLVRVQRFQRFQREHSRLQSSQRRNVFERTSQRRASKSDTSEGNLPSSPDVLLTEVAELYSVAKARQNPTTAVVFRIAQLIGAMASL